MKGEGANGIHPRQSPPGRQNFPKNHRAVHYEFETYGNRIAIRVPSDILDFVAEACLAILALREFLPRLRRASFFGRA